MGFGTRWMRNGGEHEAGRKQEISDVVGRMRHAV